MFSIHSLVGINIVRDYPFQMSIILPETMKARLRRSNDVFAYFHITSRILSHYLCTSTYISVGSAANKFIGHAGAYLK